MTKKSTPELVEQIAIQLQLRGLLLVTAESCTGGMIAAACTDLAGSSHWFDRGFITYSNDAKTQLLGVSSSMIRRHGAVSQQVAGAMAAGAVQSVGAAMAGKPYPAGLTGHVAVAVTGVGRTWRRQCRQARGHGLFWIFCGRRGHHIHAAFCRRARTRSHANGRLRTV